MKIVYIYFLMTKSHKFHCISCVQALGFFRIFFILQNWPTFAENTNFTPEKHVFSKRIIKLQKNATNEFHWFEHTHVPKP